MRVLFVQPSSAHHIGFNFMALTEPLGLEAVAAGLEGHDIDLIDLRLESGLAHRLARFKPDAVGIAVPFTTAVYKAQEVLATVRGARPGAFTFVGGHHATLSPQDFAGIADAIVLGEGEETIRDVMRALERGEDLRAIRGLALAEKGENGHLFFTPARPQICSLDATPVPARALSERYRDTYFYKGKKPLTLVETARGCPYRCKFCSVWKFHRGRYRQRSPERVAAEVKEVETENILFADDNFLENVPRADAICDLLKKEAVKKNFGFQARADTIASRPEVIAKWRDIGLDWCLVGFESFQEQELQAFNKRTTLEANEEAVRVLRKNDIAIQAAFIVDPSYGRPEFEALRRYIKRLKLFSCQITVLTPLPGTDFFRDKWQELTSRNYELFDFLHAVIPTKLPLDQFYREFCKLYRRVSVGANLKNVLKSPGSFSLRDAITGIRVFNTMLRPKSYLKGHLQAPPQLLAEPDVR